MKKIYWHYPHLKFWMGGTKFIYEVAGKINKKNKIYRIVLICNLGQGWIIDRFKKNKIGVVTTTLLFSTNSAIYWLFFPFFFIRDLLKTIFFTRDGRILVATLFPSNLIMATVSMLTGKKYFYYCYEPFPFFHNGKYIDSFSFFKKTFIRILSFLYRNVDIWATRQADKIFTLNEVTKKSIRKIYRRNVVVTLMGVDTHLFRNKKNNPVEKKYKDKIILTHSTDYSPAKKSELAVAVVRKLAKKHPNILLLITSTMPNSQNKIKLDNLIDKNGLKNNIKLLGLVLAKKLPDYYSASVCYLSCSYDEMLGTTSSNLPVKEAMACETPAIRAPITNEDVEDKISGFLTDPRDVTKVAEKISYLIKNPDSAKKMGRNGRKKILRLYNWSKVADILVNNILSND